MAEAPIHPPTPSRVAEARAAGLAPRLTASGLLAAVVTLGLLQARFVPALWQRLTRLLREPLELWARGDAPQALRLGQSLAWDVAGDLALLLAALALALGFALWLLQGPVMVWPRRSRRSFRRPALSLAPRVLFTLGLVLLLGLSLARAAWLAPAELGPLLSSWWTRLSALALGLALIDAALARERFYRALWLTRREQRDEWREAYGAPELRAARAEAQRAVHGPATRSSAHGERDE